MTDGEAAVWDLLSAELAPTQLVVQDVSGGCGSMYSIDITSEKFRGLNMVKQQRVVNALLADMVKEWHGLQLRTRTP
ncbi:bola-like protein [Thozetella sp. PMI_491]|nr:bola-like protein [Thozetella sp. PMI_491]